MKRFVPPPHPPKWINTDEELPEGPIDMRGFFRIDAPPVPTTEGKPTGEDKPTGEGKPTGEDKGETWNEEAEAIFNQVAEEFWKNGPGGE